MNQTPEPCLVVRRGSIQLCGVRVTDEEMRMLQQIAGRIERKAESSFFPTQNSETK
ncbi:hypothetical protein [Burkholderia pseudomallei]|uniref:hypothetical protein n=1 Tax=Burkholderia pseudomallei TaxID=28450 RepID=UPI000F22D80B|nr:hypothetical protein [Burkholderia pseudomallei]CAJ2932905.1 Uncharacterised protein [Burkholderia pseudomallei]VBW57690.1 Uncharacterised protein [Burkholderia pseudomallei]VBW77734.1 Uncharacterised protein [Burkholderia pseudomallei]VBW79714.1 Uncharacterised protein [Burkholderia pseudomallei]VBW79966.1 Uncharacterised protein [Burkholderia pseudomallei]